MRIISLLLFTGSAVALGADWLAPRGDAQNAGWQRDEKVLNTHTVRRLHLLWHRKLSDIADGLTDPLILGPIITDRGIKELIFVQSSEGSVYAIDADLGRTFWIRPLGSPSSCSGGRPVQPTMKASPPSPADTDKSEEDNFSDGNRPLYTITADSKVFPLRPSTGDNFSPSFRFLPKHVFPVRIAALENTLGAAATKTCGGLTDSSWTVPVSTAGVSAGRAAPATVRVAGFRVEFPWDGKLWQASVDDNGVPRLEPAGKAGQDRETAAQLATWQDWKGTRWIYTAAPRQLSAFHVQNDNHGQPIATPSWSFSTIGHPGSPVVANGVVYSLAKTTIDTGLILLAVDAVTGEELYTSKDLILSRLSSGNLGVANGHVCFSTADGQVYCFGLPVDL